MNLNDLKTAVTGDVITPADREWGDARDHLVWNGRKPDAAPAVIVRAKGAADVQAAVRYAAANGLKVSARSSGHNFSGIAMQDGVVIDLSAMTAIHIDIAARRADVQPGAKNLAMAAALTDAGLAFPLGHCGDVSMGGYLLGGGLGWNAGEWGIACHSVESADVVMADGSLIRASATENEQVFWALRGAGPAFFGIVTRYRLRLQPLPKAITVSMWAYPIARVADVTRWMTACAAVLPAHTEFTLSLAPAPAPMPDAKLATAVLTIFADSMEVAGRITSEVGAWAPEGALMHQGPNPVSFGILYGIIDQHFPDGARYGVDSAWGTDAAAMLPAMARMVETAPSRMSGALAAFYPASAVIHQQMPDTAFSMFAPVLGLVHGLWTDPAEDALHLNWLRTGMDSFAPATKGHYVGEADLARPGHLQRCYSGPARARIEVLRASYDPKGLFSGRVARDGAVGSAMALAAE